MPTPRTPRYLVSDDAIGLRASADYFDVIRASRVGIGDGQDVEAELAELAERCRKLAVRVDAIDFWEQHTFGGCT